MTDRPLDALTGLDRTRRSMGDGTLRGRASIATPYDPRRLRRPGAVTTPRFTGANGQSITLTSTDPIPDGGGPVAFDAIAEGLLSGFTNTVGETPPLTEIIVPFHGISQATIEFTWTGVDHDSAWRGEGTRLELRLDGETLWRWDAPPSLLPIRTLYADSPKLPVRQGQRLSLYAVQDSGEAQPVLVRMSYGMEGPQRQVQSTAEAFSVLLLTADPNAAVLDELADTLLQIGAELDQQNVSNFASFDAGDYDCLFSTRIGNEGALPSGYIDWLRAAVDAGTPLVTDAQIGTTEDEAAGVPTFLDLAGIFTREDPSQTGGDITSIDITDVGHPITSVYQPGERLTVFSSGQSGRGLKDGDPHVGQDLSVVGPAITVTGLIDTVAVEAGTLDLEGQPVGARVVWSTVIAQGAWTTAGRRYVRRCVNWAIDRI